MTVLAGNIHRNFSEPGIRERPRPPATPTTPVTPVGSEAKKYFEGSDRVIIMTPEFQRPELSPYLAEIGFLPSGPRDHGMIHDSLQATPVRIEQFTSSHALASAQVRSKIGSGPYTVVHAENMVAVAAAGMRLWHLASRLAERGAPVIAMAYDHHGSRPELLSIPESQASPFGRAPLEMPELVPSNVSASHASSPMEIPGSSTKRSSDALGSSPDTPATLTVFRGLSDDEASDSHSKRCRIN